MRCSIKTYLISALCLLLSALPSTACPLCNDAIAKVSGLAKGITWSILLMMGVPILVVGVISLVLAKAYQNKSTN
jgi:heme/copper-type cytochrome/quinol oxidase subunit 2